MRWQAFARNIVIVLGMTGQISAAAEDNNIHAKIDQRAASLQPEVVEWRRHIHQYPELSNREHQTAEYVASHLRQLKLDEVRTGIAYTGVVGVLRGGQPGPVIALRADMDALPVTEDLDLPFASKVRTTYDGREVGVMHACGHDAHTAILMGAAEVLASIRDDLRGTVVFLFQPAEEGPPYDEGGGAPMMIEQGALDDPRPEAIFGLHVTSRAPAGVIGYRKGALMANETNFSISIRGRQTHAASPWSGVDPITIAAQVIIALQTIPSRQLNQMDGQSLLSIGTVHGGTRRNIIPDAVELTGTFRTLAPEQVDDAISRIRRTVTDVASSAGAEVSIDFVKELPVTYNPPELVDQMLPVLERVAGADEVQEVNPVLAAEDFAFYQKVIPGFFFYLGVTEPGVDPSMAEPNHSPRFQVHEPALQRGVAVLSSLAVDFLEQNGAVH